jgi:Snf7 protein
MGSLKKFATWLSGDESSSKGGRGRGKKEPVDKVRSAITSLKIFNKRLARQVKKMEAQGKLSRKKAVEGRKRGDIPGSKLHMKSYLQYQKWSNSTDNFRVRMEGVQFKLEQAKAMQDFSGVAQDIAGVLGELQHDVQAPQISQLIGQLDLGFGNMEAMMNETTEQLEISDNASSTGVDDDEVEAALMEVDAELSIGQRSALPSVPGAVAQDEDELDDLEAEIAKLKSQRGNP